MEIKGACIVCDVGGGRVVDESFIVWEDNVTLPDLMKTMRKQADALHRRFPFQEYRVVPATLTIEDGAQ